MIDIIVGETEAISLSVVNPDEHLIGMFINNELKGVVIYDSEEGTWDALHTSDLWNATASDYSLKKLAERLVKSGYSLKIINL